MISYFEQKCHWGKWVFFFRFFFQILVTWLFLQNENLFLAAILKRNIFKCSFCWFIVGFRWLQIWCKFRTEIPTGKYLKMNGSKCAQTGVKSSLGTFKFLSYFSLFTLKSVKMPYTLLLRTYVFFCCCCCCCFCLFVFFLTKHTKHAYFKLGV